MPDRSADCRFDGLRRHLLKSGASPRYVRRTIDELCDHLEDIQLESEEKKLSISAAVGRLGDPRVIAEQVLARQELKTWTYRYPIVARVYMPIAYLLLLPAAPLFAGAANPSVVARWGASLFLSAAVTAAMLLLMQSSISLS